MRYSCCVSTDCIITIILIIIISSSTMLHYVTVLEHWISHITCLLCYFRTDLSVYFVHLLKNFCLFLAVTLLSVIGVFQLQPRVFGTVFHLILDFLSHYLLFKESKNISFPP